MTGAVTVAAVVGLLSLLSGVWLGWRLRQTNNPCPTCGVTHAATATSRS
ncbi:hypothetical protein [Paractinoplanes atraurantiacus]|uniref:FeoB-associated Cys-rich membrane protein n=1 Tax=Paractinoplanes atraurantiacus TaxID=1036182 RepID=A0A285EY57_9ACTN|nr:hypothetical protein [Actinoplanes atraurantiacus]SNY03998.1 hypothetical protein SAMN05421748_101100 [Actinoplanes atraurantiacus]